jgi:hypothetical protein
VLREHLSPDHREVHKAGREPGAGTERKFTCVTAIVQA